MTERRFTLEVRVDYTDPDKFEAIKGALQSCARQILATTKLIQDVVKPQVAMWSDDFFTGTEKIELFGDTISEGVQKLNELAGTPGAEEEAVDPELIESLRRREADKDEDGDRN